MRLEGRRPKALRRSPGVLTLRSADLAFAGE